LPDPSHKERKGIANGFFKHGPAASKDHHRHSLFGACTGPNGQGGYPGGKKISGKTFPHIGLVKVVRAFSMYQLEIPDTTKVKWTWDIKIFKQTDQHGITFIFGLPDHLRSEERRVGKE